MIKYILILILIIFVYYIKSNKIKIKWKTFLKKGFPPNRGNFGIYCWVGKQGQFKTYSCIEFLKNECKDKEIYANVKSIKGVKYRYINGFDDLLKLKDKTDIVIFYDEIFTALTKSSKMTTEVLSFLSQMRKRRIILLTTAQEWLEINITLRRYCRYQINCRALSFPFFAIIIKTFHDAENMKWSNEDNEYVAPLISTTISKANLVVAQSYDTYEQINSTNDKI